MNHWSRRSFIQLAAVCLFGAFQIGRTWSQDENPAPERRVLLGKSSSDDKDKNEERRGAEGRYQLVATNNASFIVFDTRTARGWAISACPHYPDANRGGGWVAISSPFDPPKQRPGDSPTDEPKAGVDDENAANKPPFRKIKTKIIDGKPTTNGR